jgi:FlaA1/EpsC-like NDP-sugar epimerase
VAISTDKACKPINVMGMTKSIQERIITTANILNPQTRFICVRYGNVLASRGSVIPLFHSQIRNGGPVTVTVPEMTRFLLTLDQAVDTVFTALREAGRGETYVPNAPATSIINIAQALIGNRPVEIDVTGIRPGEKIDEIMVSEEEAYHCVKRGDYYAILPMLPELHVEEKQEIKALEKEFSSADKVLDLDQTIELLKRNKLMIDDGDLAQGEELLR